MDIFTAKNYYTIIFFNKFIFPASKGLGILVGGEEGCGRGSLNKDEVYLSCSLEKNRS